MKTNIKLLNKDNQYCIYNTDNFDLFDINQFSYDVLSHYVNCGNVKDTCARFDIEESALNGILGNIGFEKEQSISLQSSPKQKFDYVDRITLHVSNDCNLRCKYCYASGGSYGRSRNMMTTATAKRFVDFCCENYKKVNNIVFFGGEPFLNYAVIKFICEYFHDKQANGEIKSVPRFGAITNGTIISDKIFFLIREHFSFITVSVDGPRAINDINRVSISGNGSYDRIQQFLHTISEFPNLQINIEATYTRQHIENGYTREMISKFFMDEFNINADIVDEMSLDNDKTVIDNLEKPLESPWFHSILSTVLNKKHETKCQILRSTFAVSIDGGIYPCHMNVGDGMKPVSTIWNKNSSLVNIVSNDEAYSLKENETCHQCWAKNICGGCSRLSFYDSERKVYSNTPVDFQCEAFRHIVEHTLLKICEVRVNPDLWEKLKSRMKSTNNLNQ